MKKKIRFDLEMPEFDYAEAKVLDYGLFPELLKKAELYGYPRPLLLCFELSLDKPKARHFEKLIGLALREFGTIVYGKEGNRLLAVTPFGSAKAENLIKTRRIVAMYGDLEDKKPCTAKLVLCYLEQEKAQAQLENSLAKLAECNGVSVLDETEIDPLNVTYLSGEEIDSLAYDLIFGLGFNAMGVGRILPERNRVEMLSSQGKPSFSLLGKSFSLERLLPFVSLSGGDSYFFVSDSRNLPPKPMAILDSIGVISLTLRFFKEKGKIIGFAYASSSRNVGFLKAEGYEALERFFALAEKRFYLLSLDKAKEEDYLNARDLSTYSDNALLRVNARGNITYMSPNLESAYASLEARINDKAAKPFPQIFGKKRPESGAEVTLSQLGSGTYRFFPLRQDEEGTITYLFTRRDETLGSRRKEKNTGIFTRGSYDSLLQEELLARRNGVLLYLRLANAEAVAAKTKPASKLEEVMNVFIAHLLEKGFGYDLYRYDENTLVYLLPLVDKDSGKSLALSLATLISKINKLGKFAIKPQVDYLLLSYPIEVAYTTDADSFVRALFGKADDFGHGRLSELNKERGRLLLPPLYQEEAVKTAMVNQEVPFRLTPVKDITTNKIAYLHLDLNIHGQDGDEILAPDVIGAAKRTNLLVKMMGLAIDKINLSYLDDRRTLKALGYQGIMFHVPMELLLQDSYYNNFLKALPNHRDFLYLRFGENEIDKKAVERLDALRKEGFKLALEDYRHEVPYEFDGYITSLFDLTGGAGEAGASFLQLCQKKARANKMVAVGFVDDPQAIAFLASSHLSYAMGQAAGKALVEKDFLTSIRNKRKSK